MDDWYIGGLLAISVEIVFLRWVLDIIIIPSKIKRLVLGLSLK